MALLAAGDRPGVERRDEMQELIGPILGVVLSQPAALLILSSACLVAYLFAHRAPSRLRERIAAFFGLLGLLLLVLLGAAWPSVYSLMAITALPALILFGVASIRPGVLQRPWVHVYAACALSLSPVAFGLQLWWLLGR